MIQIPSFGEQKFTDYQEHAGARVVTICDAGEECFAAYCQLLENDGFTKRESRDYYAAYLGQNMGLFLNYYPALSELCIVIEENCNYFDFSDTLGSSRVVPQITQVHLEDFGLSYTIRLSDGRFIVIDGGREFAPDADELMRCLKEASPHDKPIIAAWIMSHPHSDHIYCFPVFMERHHDEVVIEKFMYNFPDETVHEELRENHLKTNMEPFHKWISDLGAPVFTPHTGQTYIIGDAKCEILASMDDTVHRSGKINPTSLIIRMELGDQVILWSTDASFSDARLEERCGEHLKADILQVPHHGFGSGDHDAQIRCFDLIRPQTCLLPVSEFNAYTVFCAHRPGTRHLMTNLDVGEMITGDTTRILTLPYTPISYGALQLQQRYQSGQDNSGACSWFFTELNSGTPEDFVFTLVNATHVKANVSIEMFFEEKKQMLRHIKLLFPPMACRSVCVTDPEQVDSESVYYNPWSLMTRGIPENMPFAIRFLSDVPIVVSHKNHTPAYYK